MQNYKNLPETVNINRFYDTIKPLHSSKILLVVNFCYFCFKLKLSRLVWKYFAA